MKCLNPGQIVFCVLARIETEKQEEICASIGLAIPENKNQYGYLSEHHSFGENEKTAGEYAEKLADIMLSTTLGILPKEKGGKFKTSHICQSSAGKGIVWTSAVAAAVFVE